MGFREYVYSGWWKGLALCICASFNGVPWRINTAIPLSSVVFPLINHVPFQEIVSLLMFPQRRGPVGHIATMANGATEQQTELGPTDSLGG